MLYRRDCVFDEGCFPGPPDPSSYSSADFDVPPFSAIPVRGGVIPDSDSNTADHDDSDVSPVDDSSSVSPPTITQYENGDNGIDEESVHEDEESIRDEPPSTSILRRSTRRRQLRDFGPFCYPPSSYEKDYGSRSSDERCYVASFHDIEIPRSIEEAQRSDHWDFWKRAIEAELSQHFKNKSWEFDALPVGRKEVSSRWVFDLKRDADGNPYRYKARLVAKGFTQRFGIDYQETFAPTARLESVRTLLAAATKLGMHIHQMDIVTAFLNGELEEEIFMKPPPGIDFGFHGVQKSCRLLKSIYGLKQASRVWNKTINDALTRFGFTRSLKDPCIYYIRRNGKLLLLGLYVDDIILASECDKLLADTKSFISSTYNATDMGEINFLLGMVIKYDRANRRMTISMKAYAQRLLERFRMLDCRSDSTPMIDAMSLVVSGREKDNRKRLTPELHSRYRSGVGGLLYLARATRPDLSFSVSFLSRFLSEPLLCHWKALLRIFAYLRGTLDYGISYGYPNSMDKELLAYSDANHAADPVDRKSISGFVVYLWGGPIAWGSRRQKTTTALSSFEAEYVALSEASKDVLFVRHLLAEFELLGSSATTIWCDNDSAIANSNNSMVGSKNKHVDTRYHCIREHVENDILTVRWKSKDDMTADIFTKSLGNPLFQRFRDHLVRVV